jgi:hypothetical protein
MYTNTRDFVTPDYSGQLSGIAGGGTSQSCYIDQ